MIRDDATQRQVDAANPNLSTWLSANAGSGKTRVLTDRVARLLLAETRPENILCLTYTKAAASEMQNRLFERLGVWAMMPSNELRSELKSLGIEDDLDTSYLARARTLFASAIETPGGLKIQTIHSFCSGILRRFPLEAGVSPQFKEIEDRAAQLLRAEVLDAMAEDDDAAALAGFAQYYSGAEVDKFLAEITSRKASFEAGLNEDGLVQSLGLSRGLAPSAALSIAFNGDEPDIVEALLEGAPQASPSYVKFAKELAALDVATPTMDKLIYLIDKFLTGGARRKWPAANHTAALEVYADIIPDVHAWMDRVAEALDYLNAIAAFERTKTLFAFAQPFLRRYEDAKLNRSALDFDDLIEKAKKLLDDPAVAQWVLFRLDGGVDHVLVDEAQDTSPDQWDIIRLLTQEFATGEGANPDRERTVFVVGDKKQSIYSFQGADPEGFDRMRNHFSAELLKINKPLQNSELAYSFRSSSAILELVDQVFQGDMADGVDSKLEHLAFHRSMPGRVDLWPAIETADKREERAWYDPVDLKGKTNHQVRLARQIADEIKRMINEETLPFKPKGSDRWHRRPITPGDILILVQSRTNGIFDEVIAACKAAKLEVAGADRLKLASELAVRDISALLQFLALQEDDLSLASALKSPLFGWSEKDLYDLAQPRKAGQSLWEALRKSPTHPRTLEILTDLRDNSDFLRPYDLINRVLIKHGGRKALLARLGHEAEDGIDALLAQALSYEQADVPSLTGFLSWLQTEDVTVKRQMDAAGDRIRVMTVHGAKGLEAPIVILPDTTVRKREIKGDLMVEDPLVHWKPKAEDMPSELAKIKDKMLAAQDRERRRLLYVALTRAESWLIVAAAGDTGKTETDSWHGMVSAAMGHLDSVDHSADFGTIKRFAREDWAAGDRLMPQPPATSAPAAHTFGETLPDVQDRIKPLSPSDLGGAKIMPGDTDDDENDTALAYGRLMHLLLEHLPAEPSVNQIDVGLAMVRNQPDAGLVDAPDDLVAEAVDVINDPALAHLFEVGLVEVPITASLPSLGGRRISGLIDRLIIEDETIIAVDYKTNRVTPQAPEQTPLGLKRQMAAYRDALRQIYPNHQIRSLLLWTRSRSLTELSDQALDAALKDVTVP